MAILGLLAVLVLLAAMPIWASVVYGRCSATHSDGRCIKSRGHAGDHSTDRGSLGTKWPQPPERRWP